VLVVYSIRNVLTLCYSDDMKERFSKVVSNWGCMNEWLSAWMMNEHFMFIVFIYGKNDILDQIIIQMQIVKTSSNFIFINSKIKFWVFRNSYSVHLFTDYALYFYCYFSRTFVVENNCELLYLFWYKNHTFVVLWVVSHTNVLVPNSLKLNPVNLNAIKHTYLSWSCDGKKHQAV